MRMQCCGLAPSPSVTKRQKGIGFPHITRMDGLSRSSDRFPLGNRLTSKTSYLIYLGSWDWERVGPEGSNLPIDEMHIVAFRCTMITMGRSLTHSCLVSRQLKQKCSIVPIMSVFPVRYPS